MQQRHNNNLDILRGVAALTVVMYHLVYYCSDFDRNFELKKIVGYNFPGHMAVLVFFILSGYVIGINTPPLVNRKDIVEYIRKRLVRILPIYLAAILFTVAIAPGSYSVGTILCNIFFVSVPMDNVIVEDGPIWSLNYELLYYFIFIIFSHFSINLSRTVKVCLGVIAAVFICFHNVQIPPLPMSYFIGFAFWITGALLANRQTGGRWQASHSRVCAIFLLIYCLQPLNPYGPILKVLHIAVASYTDYSWFQQSITYADLFYFPLAILLIASQAHIYTKYNRLLLWFIFGLTTLRLAMLFTVYGWAYAVKEHYVIPTVILLSSISLWIANFRFQERAKQAIKSMAALSKISYAIYVIHLPLIMLFGRISTTSPFTYALKITAYFAVLFIASYLLEDVYQPFVRKLFFRKKKTLTPA